MEPIVQTEKLNHVYSAGTPFQHAALVDVDFTAYQGEDLGVIGHTGSGKSTLIQHLNGLLKPTSGRVLVEGQDIWASKAATREARFQVGLVFQYPEYQLFESTVIEDVKFGPRNIGMDSLQMDLHAFEALKQVGIGEELLDVSPLELSGGQKRRVAIAGVLAMEPEVLILDEPTAGLDPQGRDEILDLVAGLHKQRGITVIIASHSMEDMAKYVDRLMVMNEGTVQYDGRPEEVFSHYRELEHIGLMAPQVTYVMEGLAGWGISLPHNAITVEQAVKSILSAAGKEI